jgi:transcriptional antiterminator RfaH
MLHVEQSAGRGRRSAARLGLHGAERKPAKSGARSCSMSTNFGSRWYVAQTQPHAEAKASLHLRRQGFSIYLPRYLKQRRHARRIEEIAAPLFPRYLFVAVDLATQPWLSIDSTFGVSRLVRHGERPAPISEHVIEALKGREDANGLVQLAQRTRFSPGDKIRVVGGAFCDCAGLYEGMSSHERVAILLELLGRKVRVVLDNAVVEAA